MQLQAWLFASRPKTLTAAVVPILVGSTLAYAIRGETRLDLSALALFCSLLIQVGTNLVNDAMDFKKGADTEERIGPKRVTQSGLFSSRTVLMAAGLCFVLSACLALPLVWAGGVPILIIGLLSILAGYCYTGGPFPLAYRGLGDVFVLLFFGVVAVGGVYFLNTGRWDWPAGLAGLQIGLLATVLIAINNLRDHVTDRKANKRTLAVRWGVKGAKLQIALLCLTPFLGAVFWYAWGYKGAALLPLFSFPLALKISEKVYATEPGVLYNQFLAQAALLHFLFGVFFSLGLIQIF